MKQIIINIFVASSLIAIVLLCAEVISIHPKYTISKAVIINVQDDSKWGYIGEDKRTLIQHKDGFRNYVPGNLGNTGDDISVYRQVGTESLLGVFGDVSIFKRK